MASGKRENDAKSRGIAGQKEEVSGAVLQYQNQKLVQQLEAQKNEIHALEEKFKNLKESQISYDRTLITVNKIWNQLVDDLVFLGIRAGGHPDGLQVLHRKDCHADILAACHPEETFLCRLLKTGLVEKNEGNGTTKYVQDALAQRHSSTMNLMKDLQETIANQQAKTESISLALNGKHSSEDAILQLQKFDDLLREQADRLHQSVDAIHQMHKQYADEISSCLDNNSSGQAEIKRLSGELEESMAELEESRRKLVNLQMQKHGTSVLNASVSNGSDSLGKPADKSRDLQELKDSLGEAKTLAASRLLELQEAQEDNLIFLKQLEDIQSELKDEKYIISSRPYALLNDQLQHVNIELERCKGLIESLQLQAQTDRNNLIRKEKELSSNTESLETANNFISSHAVQIEELELQIQKLITERNDLERKLEETEQDIGRKDIKDEFRIMASALSKEMEMMEAQLNRSKEAASEALSLREQASSLRSLLNSKISEHKCLSDRYAGQLAEVKSLKALIEKLEKEKQELQFFLDMYVQEYDSRTIMEIKESEHRSRMKADYLKTALDEHSLELRVKAANEAEAACQQRLSAAEAETAELRAKLDASERGVLELTEAIRIKDAEGDAYISEIETIGQAYEDMQTQNQHLIQQVAGRDDYNIKLVSDSVKMKQTHNNLVSEKQAMIKQFQQVNESLESFSMKVARGKEQIKTSLAEAAKASLENRHVTIDLERSKLELAEAEKELKWLRSTIDLSDREYEKNQNKILELKMELERERDERKKLEEELEELKTEVVEMSSENEETAIQKLQEEIKECKAILKCGVCFDRPKEVVITKCFHLFCYPCIQRNLEIRHRKCPVCGTPFGQSDVREVNI